MATPIQARDANTVEDELRELGMPQESTPANDIDWANSVNFRSNTPKKTKWYEALRIQDDKNVQTSMKLHVQHIISNIPFINNAWPTGASNAIQRENLARDAAVPLIRLWAEWFGAPNDEKLLTVGFKAYIFREIQERKDNAKRQQKRSLKSQQAKNPSASASTDTNTANATTSATHSVPADSTNLSAPNDWNFSFQGQSFIPPYNNNNNNYLGQLDPTLIGLQYPISSTSDGQFAPNQYRLVGNDIPNPSYDLYSDDDLSGNPPLSQPAFPSYNQLPLPQPLPTYNPPPLPRAVPQRSSQSSVPSTGPGVGLDPGTGPGTGNRQADPTQKRRRETDSVSPASRRNEKRQNIVLQPGSLPSADANVSSATVDGNGTALPGQSQGQQDTPVPDLTDPGFLDSLDNLCDFVMDSDEVEDSME